MTTNTLLGRIRTALTHRRTRALLAGGVVLGLGAGATLAAYSDSEWVTGSFTADAVAAPTVLKLQGSNDNSSWSTDVTMWQATLNASRMEVGQSYYSPLHLRTTGDTNVPAIVTFPAPTITRGSTTNFTEAQALDLAGRIHVSIFLVTNGVCGAATAGTDLGYHQLQNARPTSGPEIRINPGAGTQPSASTMLCFKYTLQNRPSGYYPDRTITAEWDITATETT